MNPIVKEFTKSRLKDDLPELAIGDTVEVGIRITEGDKERIQKFSGTLIARAGDGINENITVRRIVQGEGVECIFPLHSPKIASIKVIRHGKVRRAKLYYLRGRMGKGVRLRERIVIKKETGTAQQKKKKREKVDNEPVSETDS